MGHITQILLDNGFKTFRKIYKNKQFEYVECEFKNNFNSMISGCLDYRFIKNEIEIIYGLNEYKKPPTLIYPRPKIKVKVWRNFNGEEHIVIENESYDDSMNLCLQKEDHQLIFESIFDETFDFNYDLTV